MLLSSPSFSSFLDHLSTNPTALPQAAAPQVKPEPQQEQRQMPKDVNPYGGNPSQQQIGMAMIPEQTMDFSMLNLDGYNFQPQVFVVDTPEVPAPIDTCILSGKSSNFVEPLSSDEEKVEMPVIERRPVETEKSEPVEAAPVDEEFESDPEFALYHSQPASSATKSTAAAIENFSNVDLFGGIESEKAFSRFELVDSSEEESTAALAMARASIPSASS